MRPAIPALAMTASVLLSLAMLLSASASGAQDIPVDSILVQGVDLDLQGGESENRIAVYSWHPDLPRPRDVAMSSWGLRSGVVLGWMLTGAMMGLTGGGLLGPWAVAAFVGIVGMEAGIQGWSPVYIDDVMPGRTQTRMVQLNMAAMAGLLFIASASAQCETASADPRVCNRESIDMLDTSWEALLAQLISAPTNVLGNMIWKRYRPGEARHWRVSLSPVITYGNLTGGAVGVAISLY